MTEMWKEAIDHDAMDYLIYQQNREWLSLTPTEIRTKYWKALNTAKCEKDGDSQDNIADHEEFPWKWEQGPPLLWKPKTILNQLSSKQKQGLKHLVVISSVNKVTLVKPQHQISSLKEFANLKHLEIDLSVLKFR
jgi:hypothetical protein